MRNAYRILIHKSERKGPPERPIYMWEDNLETGFMDLECESVERVYLAPSRIKWSAV
jgi:hypothetical protein